MRSKLDQYLRTVAYSIPVFFTSNLLAQDAAEETVDEIVVSGQFIEETVPLEIGRYGSRVEIITREQIQALEAKTFFG